LIEPKAFKYLTKMNEKSASDLYLTVGAPPTLRINDDLHQLEEPALSEDDISEVIQTILTAKQKRDFQIHMELNTALDLSEHGRFRINILKQRQQTGLVIRRVETTIPSVDELKLPIMLEQLSMEKRGLILLTGMTGSGKSTTLASMLDYRNTNKAGHILTIEDPIEYYHHHKKSVVTQREVGVDTASYEEALKNSLRQRPDVILIGEIRDRNVMEQALTIAETGHLCLATLHTSNAYQAIERIVNFFPEDQHKQIRLNLSMNLKSIISQRLLPKLDGGLVPATEIMLNEALVRELIQKGEYEKIVDVMEQNNRIGMCSFDQSLLDLYSKGLIDAETVLSQADKTSDIKIKLQSIDMGKEGSSLSNIDTSIFK